MTPRQKKDWAKLLVVSEGYTQKEAAKKVGASEKSISKWAKAENWDKLRQSIIMTKDEQLRVMYLQLEEQNATIMKRPEGKRFADSKESDARLKTIEGIRKLETETSIADIIEVCKRVVNYLRPIDFEKSKEVCILFDGFIKDTLKK
jgi:transposase